MMEVGDCLSSFVGRADETQWAFALPFNGLF